MKQPRWWIILPIDGEPYAVLEKPDVAAKYAQDGKAVVRKANHRRLDDCRLIARARRALEQ